MRSGLSGLDTETVAEIIRQCLQSAAEAVMQAIVWQGLENSYLLIFAVVDRVGMPEFKPEGYQVIPLNKWWNPEADSGTIYFATWEEVEEFQARPDVKLHLIRMVYERPEPLVHYLEPGEELPGGDDPEADEDAEPGELWATKDEPAQPENPSGLG